MWPLIEGRGVLAPDRALLNSWRADPRPFHAVVVALDDPRVEHRRAQVARELHPWLLATCPGQAHLTVAAVGASVPDLPANRRVEVVVSGADSFDAAAFLHADGPDLASLRDRFADLEQAPPDRFVGHVTVGTYRWPLPAHLVAQRLAPLRHGEPLIVPGKVRLIRVDRASRAGRLIEVRPPIR